ncbi:MAG: cobyric acid synthase [Deltaproteobacteria bacterium]|nr:cobyric acid synthase [Deltaproteobacteria bacterium]
MGKARPIMIQGTGSHVGKSVLTAALLRLFNDAGLRAAPFKAQNMALNSHVTADGGEIGRAQAFQAFCARLSPTVDMNPILLKPTGDSLSQVIIHGRVYGVMSAREYHGFKKEVRKFVLESYLRLASEYDVIVIEGAGSPAEVNLRENDIANMGVAELVDSPVVLVGDIDRGGVFASIVGTMELLTEPERERVRGFVINKFRGDMALLKPGLDFLEKRTGRPVLGVVPYMQTADLPDEDGVALQDTGGVGPEGAVNIAVIKLPRISNFTDFDPLKSTGVRVTFIDDPSGLGSADMAIIPGTKNTLADLQWLKDKGFDRALGLFRERGGAIAGICGGFQMLGTAVEDPYGVESGLKSVEGLSLLETKTVMTRKKDTFQVKAAAAWPAGKTCDVEGYEIHMGRTEGKAAPFARVTMRNSAAVEIDDGGVSPDGGVWGTYIHGIFDNDAFTESVIAELKRKKGLVEEERRTPFAKRRESAIEALAETVGRSLRMDEILRIAGVA